MIVFVLLEDSAGTLRSVPEPFGKFVASEEEAKRWVEKGAGGWGRGYQRLEPVSVDGDGKLVECVQPKGAAVFPETREEYERGYEDGYNHRGYRPTSFSYVDGYQRGAMLASLLKPEESE